MNWLADNLVVLVGMLGVITAGLVTGWAKTGNVRLLQAASLPLLLGVLAVAISWSYESPQEQVKRTLYETAEAIEQGDVDKVLDAFIQEATKERAAVKGSMAIYQVKDISIKNNLKVEISDSGRRAVASFNATGNGSMKGGMIRDQKFALFFVVDYVRDGDRWLIDTFEQMSADKGFKRPDARR